MAVKNKMFQPGAILHQVIEGAFRSAGTSFARWCGEQGLNPSTARNATYGQSAGINGDQLREKIIDAAGRDIVTVSYRKRMMMEAERIEEAQRKAEVAA